MRYKPLGYGNLGILLRMGIGVYCWVSPRLVYRGACWNIPGSTPTYAGADYFTKTKKRRAMVDRPRHLNSNAYECLLGCAGVGFWLECFINPAQRQPTPVPNISQIYSKGWYVCPI